MRVSPRASAALRARRPRSHVEPFMEEGKRRSPLEQGNRILSILEYLTQLNIAKIDNLLGNSEFIG